VEYQSDLKSDNEENLRRSIRKRMGIGALLCVVAPLLPFTLLFLDYTMPGDSGLYFLFAVVAAGFLGASIILYYGMGSSMLFRGLDILRQLSPPEPFIEGKFVVLNKDPVYGIAQWGSNTLFFIAFLQSERTFDQKVKVPRLLWTWQYSHPIGDIKVARREGEYTIPVEEGTYYTGRGILYSLLLEERVIVRIQKNFKAEQLNQIVDSLAQEIDQNRNIA
jgi:hypothetical protein